jgi:hypothetical protein
MLVHLYRHVVRDSWEDCMGTEVVDIRALRNLRLKLFWDKWAQLQRRQEAADAADRARATAVTTTIATVVTGAANTTATNVATAGGTCHWRLVKNRAGRHNKAWTTERFWILSSGSCGDRLLDTPWRPLLKLGAIQFEGSQGFIKFKVWRLSELQSWRNNCSKALKDGLIDPFYTNNEYLR